MNVNFKALGLVVVLQLALTAGFRPGVAAPRARAARSASGARATPIMVLSDPTRVDEHSQHDTTTQKHLTPSPELESFESGVKAMLADKRLVDEVVAQFEYAGAIAFDGVEYAGQGAVKRCLSDLFLGSGGGGGAALGVGGRSAYDVSFSALGDAAPSSPHGGFATRAHVAPSDRATAASSDHAAASVREFELRATLNAAGLIRRMVVTSLADPSAELAHSLDRDDDAGGTTLLSASGGTRPKWETYDGRVRQRIWQHSGAFSLGNPFLVETLELTTGRLICVIDKNVWSLYGEQMGAWADSVGVTLDAVIAPGNEDQKTMENCMYMLDELKRIDPLRRSEPVLAIGGGVLTDVAGFACALWRRGIPWARMPTTLLGMVDASVGIKVAINYHRKNGVGHFFSPLHTIVDASFLGTVSAADIRSGCGEIMKAALVHDGRLFDLMETHGARLIERNFENDPVADEIIRFSVDTMLECIGPDLWEESLLRPMDFGHSFSRTLEADERFALRHGEAVAIDCVMSTMLAAEKGLVSAADARRVLDLYAELGLPCSISGISAETYKRAVREITVHRDGLLRAPLPQGIGRCAYANDISDDEVDAAFARLEAFMAEHPETYWDRSWSFASDDAAVAAAASSA